MHDIIENESEGGDIHPSHYPLRCLFDGILYNDNWKTYEDEMLLSKSDLNKLAEAYGVNIELNDKK